MHSFICLFSRTGNDGLSFENCFYEQECYINIKCGVDDCRKFKVYKLVGEQIVAIASQLISVDTIGIHKCFALTAA